MWSSIIMKGFCWLVVAFLLCATSDILPTPLNLKRWRYCIDFSYPLHSSSSMATISTGLDTGKKTW